MHKNLLSFVVALLLAGCSVDADLAAPVEPIGAFRLGYAVVVADDARKVPPSRDASAQEWEGALKQALTTRFGRFSGNRLYHLAVKVDAYALAVPGVPVVLAPKSVLRLQVSVWDDAAGGKLNAEPRIFTVFERLSSETVIGSGLTRSREEQLAQLSANAARLIEGWLRDNPQWFEPRATTSASAEIEVAPLPPLVGPRPRPGPDTANVITPGE